jgi:thiol-disulfide isomerase/thioredoxin
MLVFLTGAIVIAAYYFMNVPSPLGNGPSFTLYYWNSCGHCKAMMPAWNSLGSSVIGVTIRKVERAFINNEYNVNGFPTIVFRDGKGGVEEYRGGRDRNSLIDFLISRG